MRSSTPRRTQVTFSHSRAAQVGGTSPLLPLPGLRAKLGPVLRPLPDDAHQGQDHPQPSHAPPPQTPTPGPTW